MESGWSSPSSEVGPTEDVVQALLDYLVDPVLPLKSFVSEAPSLFEQQAVAKQVHAVVLLYNYYHRKHHPALECLGFESFCKLAIILKPTLMAHMKLVHRSDYTELDDVENHISLTEKAIMDACDISSALDASKDVPVIEGWPISKVAVLLVDSRRENCLLSFGSITAGVWSVVEKDIHAFSESSGKQVSKRKRITRKPLREEPGADETSLEELIFSAVKEVAGIDQTDLMVLESHVVYSLSKEKKAARFYIVQCTQPNYKDLHIPVKDVIESSQGALVKKISSGWTVTPAVKYFHLLPYAGILSGWISREIFSNSLQDKRVEVKNMEGNSSHLTENPHDKEITEIRDTPISNQGSRISSESPKRKDIKEGQATSFSDSADGPHVMDANGSHVASPQNEDENNNTCNAVNFCDQPKVKAGLDNSVRKPCIIAECRGEEVVVGIEDINIPPEQEDVSPAGASKPNCNFLEKLQVTLSSKENQLSQTAIVVLRRKREKLVHRLRNLEDEIALCDRDIQTLQDGGDNHFARTTETVINDCSDICLKSKTKIQDSDYQHGCTERKKLSEFILALQNPCQATHCIVKIKNAPLVEELDDICYENNWKLPTYCVSESNGEYVAQITVKGEDFEFSSWSELHFSPREARESVATKTIARLRCMVVPKKYEF